MRNKYYRHFQTHISLICSKRQSMSHLYFSDRAFTLIELLVVIAILSLLMAILLPSIHIIHQHAKLVKCRSNLRQITSAWFMYLDENDEQFCRGMNRNYDFGGWKGTGSQLVSRPLNNYFGINDITENQNDAKIFKCPSDQGGEDYNRTSFIYFGNSYEANHLLVGPVPPLPAWNQEPWSTIFELINGSSIFLKRQDISKPSELLFIGDHNWLNQWDPLNKWICGRMWHRKHKKNKEVLGDEWPHSPHCYNLVFFDGHVELVEVQKGLCLTSDYRFHPSIQINELILDMQQRVECKCEKP